MIPARLGKEKRHRVEYYQEESLGSFLREREPVESGCCERKTPIFPSNFPPWQFTGSCLMLSSLILFLQPSARFALKVSLSVKTRSEERVSEEATKTVQRNNNKGGDGGDLRSEPCQKK